MRFAPKGGILLDAAKTDMSSHAGVGNMTMYGHSKLAMILFAHKMAELYPDILSTSLHPGTVETPITRGLAVEHPYLARLANVVFKFAGVSPDVGCKTQLWCSTAPRDSVQNGAYYEPVAKLGKESEYAQSKEQRNQLWEWTQKELAAHGGPGWP